VAQERLGKPLPIRQEGQGGVSADQRLEMYLNASSRAWARVKAPSSLMSRRPLLRASFSLSWFKCVVLGLQVCRPRSHSNTEQVERKSATFVCFYSWIVSFEKFSDSGGGILPPILSA
jgi:hypothetical protein